jgi:hypothetical protein
MNSLVPGIGPDILVFLTCPSPTSFLGSVAGFRPLPGSISLYFRRHGCSARAEGFFRKKLLVLRVYPVIMEDRYSRFFRVCLGRQLRSRIRPEALRGFCPKPSFLLAWFICSLVLSTKPALEFRVQILPLRLVGVSSDRMSFTFTFRRCLDIPASFWIRLLSSWMLLGFHRLSLRLLYSCQDLFDLGRSVRRCRNETASAWQGPETF